MISKLNNSTAGGLEILNLLVDHILTEDEISVQRVAVSLATSMERKDS